MGGRPFAHLDLTGDDPAVVVDVQDWLDVATAPELEALVCSALEARPSRLVVDLGRCDCADAYGLGLLVRVRERAREQGTELVLADNNARVRRTLRLIGHQDDLPVVPSSSRSQP